MKTKRRLVYYCEFCKKYKLTPQSMVIHETHCTLNPDRICRMPGCRDGNCPLCDFARARQNGWKTGDWMFWDGSTGKEGRDLKEEVREWREKFFNSEYA